jgi:ATP-dependent exoDNAse (exonuclease V) alpha subunit
VERSEKRVDAQLAREFVLALPKELSAKEQFDCAVGWAKKELVSQGMIVEVSLHHPKDGKNPHCHLLCTLRTVEGDKFSAKKPREWNDVGMLVKQRETWADACNAALEKAGRDERVDHRSLKDQGIERLPEPKIGVVATAMKRRGVLWDSERFRAVREVKMFNEVLNMMKSIKQHGKVQQHGIGPDWWHTSPLLSNVRDRAKKAFKRTWQRLVKPHQPQANKDGKNKDGFEPSV